MSTPWNLESDTNGIPNASTSALVKLWGSCTAACSCSIPLRYAIRRPDAPLNTPFLPEIKQVLKCIIMTLRQATIYHTFKTMTLLDSCIWVWNVKAWLRTVHTLFYLEYAIEGSHMTSHQADFASHCTFDRHVRFLRPWRGIGKHKKMSRNFLFSSYHNTKLQPCDKNISTHTHATF